MIKGIKSTLSIFAALVLGIICPSVSSGSTVTGDSILKNMQRFPRKYNDYFPLPQL